MSVNDWWFIAAYVTYVIVFSILMFGLIFVGWWLYRGYKFRSYETTMQWVEHIRDKDDR